MALTFPLSLADFADTIGIRQVKWLLQDNRQYSGMGSGQILQADLGPSLWTGDVTLREYYHTDARRIEALLNAVIQRQGSFYLYDPRKCVPASGVKDGWYAFRRWDFDSDDDLEGWSGNEERVQLEVSDGLLTMTCIGQSNSPYIASPTFSFSGADWNVVRARVRRTTGSGPINAPRVFPFGTATSLTIDSPDNPDEWNVLEWDLSGDSVWTSGTFTGFYIYLGKSGDVFEIDHIEIGGRAFPGTVKINSLPDAKSMTLKGLPAGYKLSAGDYLSFDYGSPARRAFHEICEDVTANGSGVTPAFEVNPAIRTGAAVDDAVTLVKPAMKCIIRPGTLDVGSTGNIVTTQIGFSVVQKL